LKLKLKEESIHRELTEKENKKLTQILKCTENNIKNQEEEIKFFRNENKELNIIIKIKENFELKNKELLLEIKNKDSIIKYLEAMINLSKGNKISYYFFSYFIL
jgi:hypothetical protein